MNPLNDPCGNLSSKRVYAAIALAALLIEAGADLFGHRPSEFIVTAFVMVIGSGVLGATADHWAPKKE